MKNQYRMFFMVFLSLVLAGVVQAAVGPMAVVRADIISSLSRDGKLTYTGLEPGSIATVEWSLNPSGPWTEWVTKEKATITVDPSGVVTVKVPMDLPAAFFRISGLGRELAPTNMALVPAGSFQMSVQYQDTCTVFVSAFYMDKYEVTKALWDEVYQWAIAHGYDFDNAGSGKEAPDHPVNMVNWSDAAKWCNARSEKEGLAPAYYAYRDHKVQTTGWRSGEGATDNRFVKWNAGYRLPTDAEWQKAARGGASEHYLFPWGDTITHGQANYYSRSGNGGYIQFPYDISPTRGSHPVYATGEEPYTSPVGSFAPNGYGLYDMAGNVNEWCWDFTSTNGNYDPADDPNDPRGPTSSWERIFHGGSWNNYADRCRVDVSKGYAPGSAESRLGFRCALPLP